MRINDKIYGTEEIKEPILIDLINSKEMRRLTDVSQLGLPEEYYNKKNFSRYEHTLGVLIQLRRLGANLLEQIAGTLHDINHPAFSHVIDWIFGDPTKENHQDKSYVDFLKNSSIPFILSKHGLDYRKFFNLKKFKLLERNAPSLCADRIDYSLREMSFDGKRELASELAENLINFKGQIVFKDKKYAEIFAKEYMFLQEYSWGSPDSRMRYVLLSDALKKGIENKIISKEDLKNSEKEILNSLEKSGDDFINYNLRMLKKGFELVEDKKGIELKTKFRYIDPEFSYNGSYKKLSEVSEKYLIFIETEKRNSNNYKKMRAIPIENDNKT
jgi:uncharacterized protein